MRVAVAASRSSDAAPAGIEALIGRYDPAVIDVPDGRALVRLRVRGGEDWDARIEGDRVRLEPAREGEKPDAAIAADPPTWMRVAGDVRAGMQAFQRGRLRVRGSLHLGVGFLAATSAAPEPGRLRFERVRTPAGRGGVPFAGARPGAAVFPPPPGGAKRSLLPTVAALAHR